MDATERDPGSGDDPLVAEQEELAAAEAARIGGQVDQPDDADRPVREAGGGEAEGFEQAEDDLIEHASHGDQHSARVPLYDAGEEETEQEDAVHGEPDALPPTAD